MISQNNDKRTGRRTKKEMPVAVKTGSENHLAYTIDFSRGGIMLGSPVLYMSIGERVELLVEKNGQKIPFSGQVVREGGLCFIDRIRRSVNTFFVEIADARFHDFVINNFYV